MIKTKIVATLGPSCRETETIMAMIDHGVDVFRLNFSHGTLAEHGEILRALNAARSQHRHAAGAMGDHERIADTIKFATTIVATMPILLVYPFLQKYFVQGVMIGSVKG